MKKIVLLLVSVLMVLSLTACGGSETEAATPTDEVSTTKKAILVVNGSLGDLGFFDSANRGMLRLEEELGFEIKVIETGSDETKWEPALVDAAEEDVDYVIACSPSMIEPMERIASDFPDKKFILVDNAVDFESYDLSNVYCATFKQNEGSFLAGVAAAITAGEEGKLGFVGGMDIPAINDFLVGYIEGAVYANPDIKVIATYPGDYYDPAKGKEHAIVLINQGVNCIFTAAGPTGLGSIQAAVDAGIYVIGVDSDQSSLYASNGDELTAAAIVTSMVKNVGDVIFNSVSADLEGNLEFGTADQLGIEEGAVGLAKNAVYEDFFTAEQKAKIEDLTNQVVEGEITVRTAIGMSSEELNELKASVAQ